MDTDALLDQIAQGDPSAINTLFARHKIRLRHMIALRIDDRLATRIDPSDVVQEAMAEAHRRLPEYLSDRKLPFYPWLRSIAWDQLIGMHRRHMTAQRRSVRREVVQMSISSASAAQLVDRLATPIETPSSVVIRRELRARLQDALSQLSEINREVIVLKHLEELTFNEVAAVLQLTDEAARSRYRRAIQRLHTLLES